MKSIGWIGALCCLCVSCSGATADNGSDAFLRIENAQFVQDILPEASGGPEITSVLNATNTFQPGEVDRPLSGTLSPEATAVLIGLEGDRGHWVVVAGAPEVTIPDQPTFNVLLTWSNEVPLGEHRIVLSAVDAQGNVGPRSFVDLEGVRDVPQGELVIALSWDRDADLDLRVIDPTGVEIWSRNPNSAAPSRPGVVLTPEELAAGGALDTDSNGQCVIDGRRREHVIWRQTPPTGRYRVLVDTFSMCEERSARWRVDVWRQGELGESAQGISTPFDTRGNHDSGAGLLVLEFDL